MKFRLTALSIFLATIFISSPLCADEIPDFTSLPVGELQIYPIHDADTTMEASLLPDLDKYPQFRGLFKRGPAQAVSQTFFFKLGQRNVLIDGGWGNELRIKGQTQKILAANGISPDAITDILLTHLDMDHVGGLLEKGKAVYPNATLWIAEPEAKAWQEGKIKKRPDFALKLAQSLWQAYAGHIKLFKHGEEILPGVFAVDAAGHTPGHTAFDIVSGQDKMTVAGDLLHIWQIQLQEPKLSTTYDMDTDKAADTRIKLLSRAAQEKSLFAGMHFPMVSDVQKRPDSGFMMREPR